MLMNVELYDKIYKILKDFLTAESAYKPIVTKLPQKQSNKFPLVVITEEDNAYLEGTTRFEETRSKVDYEINIYTTDIAIDNKKISRLEVAKELKGLVDNVMNCNLKMRRRSCRPTPNLDKEIYRITMRYSASVNDNTGKLF